MKFGVFTVSMPEYGIRESAQLLSELGYDGVEWRVAEIPGEKPKDIPYDRRYWIYNESTLDIGTIEESAREAKKLCDERGIEIFSLTTYLKPGESEKIERVLKAAQAIGCRQVRVFPRSYDGKENYNAMFAEMIEQTKVLEALAKKYGVKIVFEIHMDTLLASPSSAYRLVSNFDPRYIGLIFDPGNMVNEGFEDYQKSFELLGDYIAHVHVKNGLLAEDGTDEYGALKWKRQWCPIKKGMADLGHFFAVMKKQGYDGTVCIEDFSNEENTRDKLAHNLKYIKQLSK
jgi:sugar phosphate isomerase/epimerase